MLVGNSLRELSNSLLIRNRLSNQLVCVSFSKLLVCFTSYFYDASDVLYHLSRLSVVKRSQDLRSFDSLPVINDFSCVLQLSKVNFLRCFTCRNRLDSYSNI